jgi:hypothetical protein
VAVITNHIKPGNVGSRGIRQKEPKGREEPQEPRKAQELYIGKMNYR